MASILVFVLYASATCFSYADADPTLPKSCSSKSSDCSLDDSVVLLQQGSLQRSRDGSQADEGEEADDASLEGVESEEKADEEWPDWVDKAKEKAVQALTKASTTLASSVNTTLDALEAQVDKFVQYAQQAKPFISKDLNGTLEEKLPQYKEMMDGVLANAQKQWSDITNLVKATAKTIVGALRTANQEELAANIKGTFDAALLQAEEYKTMLIAAQTRVKGVVMTNAAVQLSKFRANLNKGQEVAREFVSSFQDAFKEFADDLENTAKEKLPKLVFDRLVPTLRSVQLRADRITEKLFDATRNVVQDTVGATETLGVGLESAAPRVRASFGFMLLAIIPLFYY